MKRALPCLVAVALLAGGCTSTSEDAEEVELSLHTQAEADAKASSKITKSNADEEMARLAEEISADEEP